MGDQRLLNFSAIAGTVDSVTLIDSQSGETERLREGDRVAFAETEARPSHSLVGVAALPSGPDDPEDYEWAKRVYQSEEGNRWWTEDIDV